ncbi:MAG: type II secretion system protein [Desulfobacteraceae bacterium]|nr:type II secretion system protein [Desulfobacteraceae bacterium]
MKRLKSHNGFTLIEVLVAVMILGISLVVIMQLFSGGLKSNKISNDYLYGIFHAREKMEELLLTREWAAGEQSGDFGDGYRWTAAIEEVVPDAGADVNDKDKAELAKKLPVSTLLIRLDVIWMNGDREKRFELTTTALTEKLNTAETPE